LLEAPYASGAVIIVPIRKDIRIALIAILFFDFIV